MSPASFDPYAILHELEQARVAYAVIGGLARVIQGSDELTRGLDLTPSLRPKNLERLEQALGNLHARRVDRQPFSLNSLDAEQEPLIRLRSDAGEIKIVPVPEGTRGYEDLRRRAVRQPLGEGLRPAVAGAGDLVRMIEALGREPDTLVVETMRRVVELDRSVRLER